MFTAHPKTKYIFGAFTAIALILLFSYANISSQSFLHWDDLTYVLKNDNLRPLSISNLITIFSDFSNSNWHPLTWLSYSLNFAILGESAVLFKATNLMIHFANCILLFYLAILLQVIARTPGISKLPSPANVNQREIIHASLLAALLFAIHPQHVESVSWISGRKDLLCALFYFSAIIAYIHMQYSDNKRMWTNFVSLFYVCALMSKSMAVTFPLLVMLLDVYPLRRFRYENSGSKYILQLLNKKVMYIFLALAVTVITIITQTPNITGVEEQNLALRISNAAHNYFYYIYSIFLPNVLIPYHPLTSDNDNISFQLLLPIILFIVLVSVCWYLYKKRNKHTLFIFLAYLILLLPAIGLVHVGHAARADRYAYLPTSIFYIIVAIVFMKVLKSSITKQWTRFTVYGVLGGICAYLAFFTYHYNSVWANDKSVWQEVVDRRPNASAIPYINLGNAYFEEKHYDSAINNYLSALKIHQDNLDALRNIGFTYETLNDDLKAEKYYKLMVTKNPDAIYGYTVMGDFYFRKENYNSADFYYSKALQIDPQSESTLLRAGMLDIMKNQYAKAEKKIDIFLTLNPDDVLGLRLKAKIRLKLKDLNAALEIANKILELSPDDEEAAQIIAQIEKQQA